MPLSAPAPRQRAHTRTIHCEGFQREDGLFDIEGRLSDAKDYAFENRYRGAIPPGGFLHDMRLRLTVDRDFVIVAVEAASTATPFAGCLDAPALYQALVGESLTAGFTKRSTAKIGGVAGCTHITELLGRLATVAHQTIHPLLRKEPRQAGRGRPGLIDSCIAFRADGDVVRAEWPMHYTGGDEPGRQRK